MSIVTLCSQDCRSAQRQAQREVERENDAVTDDQIATPKPRLLRKARCILRLSSIFSAVGRRY
jgi:hypothetical protein